jgi:hypothetical protein
MKHPRPTIFAGLMAGLVLVLAAVPAMARQSTGVPGTTAPLNSEKEG